MIKPVIKIMLSSSVNIFGPGISELLKEIEIKSNIKDAALSLGMSYSKARNILKRLEDEIGFEVITIKYGGKKGGETYLTENGKELLKLYDKYREALEKESNRLYDEILGGLLC